MRLTSLAGDYKVEQKVTSLYLMRDFVNGECPRVEVIAVINAGKTDSGSYSRLIWRKVTRQNALELRLYWAETYRDLRFRILSGQEEPPSARRVLRREHLAL